MKKLFALMLALALMLGMLAGCAQKAPETTDETVAPAEETTTQEQTPAQEQPATEESSGNDDLVKIGFICGAIPMLRARPMSVCSIMLARLPVSSLFTQRLPIRKTSSTRLNL